MALFGYAVCGTHVINTSFNCSSTPSLSPTSSNNFSAAASAAEVESAWNVSDYVDGGLRVAATTATSASATSSTTSSTDFQTAVELYVISLLIVVGLVGNVVSVIVLRRDKERRDVLFLLQALAVADLLYLLAAALRYPLKYLLPGERFVEMQPIVFPLLKTFQTVTIWMMVLVTVDRFSCVCRPLDAPRLFNSAARRRYAVAVFAVGFAYNAPRYADSCVYRWYDVCTRRVYTRMSYRESFTSPIYYDIYGDILYTLLLYIGPLTILIFMNCKLVQAIR